MRNEPPPLLELRNVSVALLQRGRVVADGPKENVLTSEQSSALLGARVRVFRKEGCFHVHS
jgi:ABC-type hemin transport system ATPase subunit